MPVVGRSYSPSIDQTPISFVGLCVHARTCSSAGLADANKVQDQFILVGDQATHDDSCDCLCSSIGAVVFGADVGSTTQRPAGVSILSAWRWFRPQFNQTARVGNDRLHSS